MGGWGEPKGRPVDEALAAMAGSVPVIGARAKRNRAVCIVPLADLGEMLGLAEGCTVTSVHMDGPTQVASFVIEGDESLIPAVQPGEFLPIVSADGIYVPGAGPGERG